MAKKQIQFPAIVDSLSTKKDGSIKVVLETQELLGSDVGELLEYRQKLVYVTLTETAVDSINVPDEIVDPGRKTQAQRLRGVLYRLWEQQGSKGNSEDFYNRSMERLIDVYKEKLN